MAQLWNTKITLVGGDARDMLEGGVLILFGEPVPEALADVSVVHAGASALARPLTPGDELVLDGHRYTLVEVGDRACDNLIELGHVVVYVNAPEQELLPGAIKATGPDLPIPAVGGEIAFHGG